MKKSEVNDLLIYVMADYAAPISQNKVDVWSDALKNVDSDIAMEAARYLVRRGDTYGPPKVSDLLKAILEVQNSSVDAISGEQAWTKVITYAANPGRSGAETVYKNLAPFPLILDAVKTIGFELICNTELTQLPFLKKNFIEYYDSLRLKEQTQSLVSGNLGIKTLPQTTQRITNTFEDK